MGIIDFGWIEVGRATSLEKASLKLCGVAVSEVCASRSVTFSRQRRQDESSRRQKPQLKQKEVFRVDESVVFV